VPQHASSSFVATENVNTKILKRDFLAKQAQITADWINDAPLDQVDHPAEKAKKEK